MPKFFIRNNTTQVVKQLIPGVREFIFNPNTDTEVPSEEIANALVKDYHNSLIPKEEESTKFTVVVK